MVLKSTYYALHSHNTKIKFCCFLPTLFSYQKYFKVFYLFSFKNLYALQIFSPILRAVFHFACGFLCCVKTFKFSRLIYFYFHYSGRWVIEDHAVICVRECFDLLPSRSFIVSGLMFRSLIHFEFMFVYGVRELSNFTLLHAAAQFSQHHLLKRLYFLHCIFLPLLSKTNWS